MLVCSTCGSIMVPEKEKWVCSFVRMDADMAHKMYEKPHLVLVDKRVCK